MKRGRSAASTFAEDQLSWQNSKGVMEYFERSSRAVRGLSVLVNTSFNMHEEPIVCTPDDALKAFFESNLDALAIGPFLVRHSRK